MVGHRVLARLRDAVALLREDVQQDRPLLILQVAQPAAQRRQIVTVDRAEVAEAEIFEEHAARHHRLEAVADLLELAFRPAADDRHLFEESADLLLGILVEVRHPPLVERMRQSAGARADRHLVVVENDEQVLLQPAGVVQRFEDDAARQGAVADDGDRFAVGLAHQIVADLEAEHGRDRRAGVAGHEQVEVGLVRIRVAHQPAARADRVELRIAAGDQLVRIDLVAGVPDQPIALEVEGEVQRQAKLDDAEVGGEVGRPDAEHANEFVAHLLGKLLELLVGERMQIGGRLIPDKSVLIEFPPKPRPAHREPGPGG